MLFPQTSPLDHWPQLATHLTASTSTVSSAVVTSLTAFHEFPIFYRLDHQQRRCLGPPPFLIRFHTPTTQSERKGKERPTVPLRFLHLSSAVQFSVSTPFRICETASARCSYPELDGAVRPPHRTALSALRRYTMLRTWDGPRQRNALGAQPPHDPVMVLGINRTYLEKLVDIRLLSGFLRGPLDRLPGIPDRHATKKQVGKKKVWLVNVPTHEVRI